MKERCYFVYILTRKRNSVFYTGVTSDLIKRVYQHKMESGSEFTTKYDVKKLVYFECYHGVLEAIHREKMIKKWKRRYKINAIEKMNLGWRDLYYDLIGSTDRAMNSGE